MAKKQMTPKREKLIDRFADIFHSFEDLRRVTPLDFLARLGRKGIVISRKPKRRTRHHVGSPKQQRAE